MNLKTGFLLMASCITGSGQATTRVDVTRPNDLGIVELETTQSAGVFELRGLDANGNVRAVVTRRVGEVADLAGKIGSEVTVSVDEANVRMFTRETNLVRLSVDDLRTKSFLELDEVSDILMHNRIDVVKPPPVVAAGDTAYWTASCLTRDLLTSPTAQQCCESWDTSYDTMKFIRPSDGKSVWRERNHYGYACTAQDGFSACDGASCYYGPNAFARASIYDLSGWYPKIVSVGNPAFCQLNVYTSPQTPVFGDVTGEVPTGLGCPGGDEGGGQWDF